MTTHLYCFAGKGRYGQEHILQLQANTVNSAYSIGKIESIFAFTPADIDPVFFENNKHILTNPRGAGYWLWKYYFAIKLLESTDINKNDLIIYCDSKITFREDVSLLTDVFQRDNLDIMTFNIPHEQEHLMYVEKVWTKRDCFVYMNMDDEKYVNTIQGCGGFFMFKKSDLAYQFFQETLKYSQDYRILTDSPNECGLTNYDGYIEHRHDQSVKSLMSKKYKIHPYRLPWIDNSVPTHICTPETYPLIVLDEKSTYPAMLNIP